MKATEEYFPMMLFIMLYKVVRTFEFVDEILTCDHSNESYWAVLSCGAVYYAVQSGSNVWVRGWNPYVWPFKWKPLRSTFLWCCLLCCTKWFERLSSWMKSLRVTIQMKATEQYFPVVLFITLYKVVLTFESVDEIRCDHSNESHWRVLSSGAVYWCCTKWFHCDSNWYVCGWNSWSVADRLHLTTPSRIFCSFFTRNNKLINVKSPRSMH